MDLDVAAGSAVEVEDGVDAILRRDPIGAYPRMDALSRRDYRERVRMWARRSGRQAQQTAQLALDLAEQCGQRHGSGDRRAHVGYFLTDIGVRELAAALGARLNWRERLRLHSTSSLVLAYCLAVYSICAAFGIVSVWLFEIALPWYGQALLAACAALYANYIVQSWINLHLPQLLLPRRMPRLDFGDGIPAEAKTLVAIPCLLVSREGVAALARALERLHQSNPGTGVGYALLSDFVDAASERVDGDEALLQEAREQIDALNARHGGGFVLLHRPRRWNPGENLWIGWERKRGKLEELNAWLLGGPSPFQVEHGDLAKAVGSKYVVTLDEDNDDLTAGALRELAAAIAHPLNRPVLDANGTRVEAGYVVLQPRAMISLSRDSAPSRLELMIHAMIEIETSKDYRADKPAVHIDQDLFGQAAYGGKGIYDVAMFHRLTHGRIAENTILSHDVLEGGMVRAGVVSDVVLRENFVPTFHAAMRRSHRWMRGDWQLLPWLLPSVRDASGARVRNTLSLFGRWKIFHNALRMVLPIASLLCFVLGWASSAEPGLWTLNLLAIAWVPAAVGLCIGIARNLLSGSLRSVVRGVWSWLSLRSASFIFGVDQAQTAFDAAVRASFRMLVSHRKLLEWTASSVMSARRGPSLGQYLRMMWISPAFAVAVVWLIGRINPPALSSAIPFAALWACAPVVAWWWSQKPRAAHPAPPSQA
ncbi:hypothetical protein RDV84_19790 [Lysobacter yananisis]|uniref:Glycosyl transferase n=1 Tax=Lysobacter yananisis TaxID=1003114 RepID=A0ABY9P8K1_9GAMM|nr:hypothetical protein [Lysobacter yananisis]WMT02187.1 hypothetical protein RDV84_19790 [Lysobacter yananisis]